MTARPRPQPLLRELVTLDGDTAAEMLSRWARAVERQDWGEAKRLQVQLRTDYRISILLLGK